MKKVRKAILPVAGLGTRFLPVTKALPKEMLPIIDKPILHYLVEELNSSDIKEIIMVTSRGKECIENYFDHNIELEKNLEEKGRADDLAEMQAISSMAKTSYTRQPQPHGNGYAILCAENLIDEDEPVAILFGDDLIYNPGNPAIKQMLEVFEKKQKPILCVEEVPDEMIPAYGIIDIEGAEGNVFKVKGIVEKPKLEESPSNMGVIGKYIITPEIIKILKELWDKKEFKKELGISDAFHKYLSQGGEIYAIKAEGKRYDTGDKWGIVKATVDFAMEREDLKEKLKKHLGELGI